MRDAAIEVARERGWHVGSRASEATVALELERLGYAPADVEVQFPLGPYRLDFAIAAARLDIEADGWVHTTRDVRAKDYRRDRRLREWGWTVVRIATDRGDVGAQLRRHIPDRSCIREYGETLRRIDVTFELGLRRLQRQGVSEPGIQLTQLRSALAAAIELVADGKEPSA